MDDCLRVGGLLLMCDRVRRSAVMMREEKVYLRSSEERFSRSLEDSREVVIRGSSE